MIKEFFDNAAAHPFVFMFLLIAFGWACDAIKEIGKALIANVRGRE